MAQIYTFPTHPLLVFSDDADAWLAEMKAEIDNPPDRGYPRGARWPIFTESRLAAMTDLVRDPSKDTPDVVARLDLNSQEGGRVWYGVRDAIHKLPNHQERLLDLVVVAHQQTPGDYKQPLEFPDIFGQYTNWSPSGVERNLKKNAAESFLAETFMAKLTARGLAGPQSDDAMKHLAAWRDRGALALRQYLESTPWDPKSATYEYADDPEEEEEEELEDGEEPYIEMSRSVRMLDYTVLFVHPWIAICGGAFYDACVADPAPVFPSDVPGENRDNNFGVGKGYCMARWDFWRDRLQAISETEELMPATRDVARDCVARMREVEMEKGRKA
ncbi:hypothetical protein RB597_010153 [Gaeumannomyces tritici]